ncbi:unnamed protein product [Adineta ricciae]|uniref:Uncharacterized protein n=1 Tax=Adineta ricciae TaxID=249248 RepID=A0A816DVK2_ADIRI|nr:unnamed protein product [Adineta ricciae]CAF1638875.1 unnamed protein product [Adineta ricciae]
MKVSISTITSNQCGSVSKMVLAGTTDSIGCIVTFNSSDQIAEMFFAAAIIIEDFSKATSLIPSSSAPAQFIIQTVGTLIYSLKSEVGRNRVLYTRGGPFPLI